MNKELQLSLCRLCLSYTTRPISLLSNNNNNSEMLEALTTIKILPNDDISTVSCFKCLLNLKFAFYIQQNILKAEQRFRGRFLSEIKQEFRVEDEIKENIAKVDTLETPKFGEYSNDVIINKEIETLSVIPVNFKIKQENCSYVHDICEKDKKPKRLLKIHKTSVHQYETCTICNTRLKKTQLRSHMCLHNDKSIGVNEGKETNKLISKTVNSETNGFYVCDICGIAKKTKVSLRDHKYAHQYTSCKICKKRIKKIKLQAHVELHNVDSTSVNRAEVNFVVTSELEGNLCKLYVCDICGQDKKTMAKLKAHKNNVHQYATCTICNKKITKHNLRKHINRHTNKMFVCDICGISVKHLETHIRYKHQNSGYKCKLCDKIFRNLRGKASHELRDHNGEQKFICDVCGKKFYFNRHLKVHVERVHLKQKSFSCKVCNVDFSSKYSLQTHMRTHTNETPYKCEFCGDGFRHKVSLKSHLKSKHEFEEKLTCECKECGKMFASKAALISHGRIH